MEVCLVMAEGKVNVLGDDRLANLRLTAKQRDGTHRQLALSGQCLDAKYDSASHTGGVREIRCRKRTDIRRSLTFRTSKNT
jgi:hypothetical protein